MTSTIVLFAFATLGSKVLLGFAVVYLFLPQGVHCGRCDGETVRVLPLSGFRGVAARLRIEQRWCAHCSETVLTRRSRPPARALGVRNPLPDPAAPPPVARPPALAGGAD